MAAPLSPETQYIFLSYASADRERAIHIADLLEEQGIAVWMDRHSIEGGTSWSAEIVRGIRGCSALIVLCTVAAMRSRNVQQEIQLAWEHNKALLPLLLDVASYPDEVAYVLTGRQWVDVLDLPEDVWLPRALQALARLGVRRRDTEPVAPAPTEGVPPASDPLAQQPRAGAAKPAGPRQSDGPARRSTIIARLTAAVAQSPLAQLRSRAPLVGRAEQLAYLRREYDAASAGQGGRVVLISGESGVGKTRLAEEIGAYAESRGGVFLRGYYARDTPTPYSPWVEALRPYFERLRPDTLATVIGPFGWEFYQIFPDLAPRLGPPPPAPAIPPGDQRRRLLDGASSVVVNLSRLSPLVLLLDDLQWAPELAPLAHLARHLGESRALVLGTYRDQEFRDEPALMQGWVELKRSRLLSEIVLAPLTEEETGRLVAHYFGEGPTTQLRGPVYRQTRGNAFFVEEVLRSLAESGVVRATESGWEVGDLSKITIPESMKLTIEARIARLGESGRDVLVHASVLGMEFSFPALQLATGLSDDDLALEIERAVAARLLEDRSTAEEERFAFTDDRVQEVLYASLTALRRRRLHRQAGEALEAFYADCLEQHLDELARHFTVGNDLAKMAEYASRAAETNSRVFNWSRARQLYETAAEALAHLPDTEENRRRRIETILKMVNVTYDDPERGQAWLAEALGLARTLPAPASAPPGSSGEDHLVARVLYAMGHLKVVLSQYAGARESFEQAAAAARAAGDERLALLIDRSIGIVLWTQG
ncbi:MAG TPA: AAA family ATPase, partial [Dehalococcoidia bacterium]|nr:AAA family ATPase [Dehalococcoidia bacterium]